MSTTKPHVTKTHGPIHFEDLDPHRFEDLVRELIYDYKDWQSIEATGRSGNDAGFDIRGYEKATSLRISEELDDLEDGEGQVPLPAPMDGNVWMVQVKRESAIGPKRVQEIIAEVSRESPPYGYILTAPANFSRVSYDAFREGLRAKGVMEFYLWGKAELEDMLHLPKNDRILFTFFGISLVSRRRSRTTEIRAAIAMKNKLYRAIGEGWQLTRQFLLRDVNDTHYPYEDLYANFDEHPRWKEYTAVGHHPVGIWLNRRKYYAYVDPLKKQFDFTDAVDLRHRDVMSEEERDAQFAAQRPILDFWERLPKSNRATLVMDALLAYREILAVDEKGDVYYSIPHVFSDLGGDMSPYCDARQRFEIGEETIQLADEYKRIKVFPTVFEPVKPGRLRKGQAVTLDAATLKEFNQYHDVSTLYDTDGKYRFLKAGDVIAVTGSTFGKAHIQITHVSRATVGDYLKYARQEYRYRRAIQQQIGTEVSESDMINSYEYRRYHGPELREDS